MMELHDKIEHYTSVGASRREVEAMLGRRLTDLERIVYDRARLSAKLAAARERSERSPVSGADRKAAHIARRNEIGSIPAPRHRRLVEACRVDLKRFGWTFCRPLLEHLPSDEINTRLIQKMQQAILSGGQLAVEFSRGLGKTTWTIIAFVWALLYGHRRFPVCIAASKPLAKSIRNTVLAILETYDYIALDFPAVAIPLRAIGGVVQRAASVTYHGRPIGFESTEMMFRLPDLRDDAGNPLSPACGAHFACRGIGASVRGLNEMGDRPDFILFDDPQTQKDARSATAVERLDRYIHGDALNLGANTTTMAAFMTITPQHFGDLAHRIADKNLHPNWSVSKCPFLINLCQGFEALADEFIEAYNIDAANDDFERTESRRWYRANASRFAGTVPADPLAFDRDSELDAIHHALNKMAAIGKQAFAAEYQMSVEASSEAVPLLPEEVCNALTGLPANILPPGTTAAVAFVDVNIQRGTGLSCVILALGRSRVTSVVNYLRYPQVGQLVKPGASDLAKRRAVAGAIRAVVAILAGTHLRTSDGRRVQLRAVGFDRGYMPDTVCRTLFVLRKRMALPFQLCAVRGFGWQQFGAGRRADVVSRGDHVFVTRSDLGEYLAVHTPYWREVSQSGFHDTPLTPGSCSVFGDDPKAHWEFANEVAAERLIRKYVHPSGKLAWDWSPPMGPNHYGDCLTGCFAVASWFRLYDALPNVLDATASGKPAPAPAEPPAEPDLFSTPHPSPSTSQPSPAASAAAAASGLKTLAELHSQPLNPPTPQPLNSPTPQPLNRPRKRKRAISWKRL